MRFLEGDCFRRWISFLEESEKDVVLSIEGLVVAQQVNV